MKRQPSKSAAPFFSFHRGIYIYIYVYETVESRLEFECCLLGIVLFAVVLVWFGLIWI